MMKRANKFRCWTLGTLGVLLGGIVATGGVARAQPEGTSSSATAPATSEPPVGSQTPAGSPAPAAGGDASAGAEAETLRPAVEDSDQAVQLRDLEERVNDLKERIFRSKARLILLRETVLNGVISGAKALVVHRNEMGASFSLQEATYSLDGAPLYNKTDVDGDLDDKEEIELFNGSIVPGNHNLTVYLLYKGNGYGIFSYLKGYTFKIKSSYAFTAEEGKRTTVKVVAFERGGFTTDLKDRPAVRYDVEVKQDTGRPGAPAEGGQEGDGSAAQPQDASAPSAE